MIALLWMLTTAHAEDGDYASQIAAAKTAMLAKDWAAATAALSAAEKAAPASSNLISNADIGRLSFFQGIVAYRSSGKIDSAMEAWRRTLALAPDYQPDKDVLPETDAQDVFYALAEEQRGKEQVALGLPEDPGDVMIFVDGRRYEPMDSVYLGNHFIQLRCAEGNVISTWYSFGSPPPDWLAPCNGGSYPVAAGTKPPKPAKPPKPEPKPKATASTEPKPTPEPKPKPEPTPEPKPTASTEPKPKPEPRPAPEPKATRPKPEGGNGAGWALLGGGAALMLGGVATNFLMVNPAYDQIQSANEDPGSVKRSEADVLESRFRTGAYATIGLFALGGAAAASGVVVTVVDWHVGVSPSGIWLSGHF